MKATELFFTAYQKLDSGLGKIYLYNMPETEQERKLWEQICALREEVCLMIAPQLESLRKTELDELKKMNARADELLLQCKTLKNMADDFLKVEIFEPAKEEIIHIEK